jgi:hypothetical protein
VKDFSLSESPPNHHYRVSEQYLFAADWIISARDRACRRNAADDGRGCSYNRADPGYESDALAGRATRAISSH